MPYKKVSKQTTKSKSAGNNTYKLKGWSYPGSPRARQIRTYLILAPFLIVIASGLLASSLNAGGKAINIIFTLSAIVGIVVSILFTKRKAVQIKVSDNISIDGKALLKEEVDSVKAKRGGYVSGDLLQPIILSISTKYGLYVIAACNLSPGAPLMSWENTYRYRGITFLSNEDFAQLESVIEKHFGPINKQSF